MNRREMMSGFAMAVAFLAGAYSAAAGDSAEDSQVLVAKAVDFFAANSQLSAWRSSPGSVGPHEPAPGSLGRGRSVCATHPANPAPGTPQRSGAGPQAESESTASRQARRVVDHEAPHAAIGTS